MIVAILGRVVFAANIDDGVTCREKSWVAGANEG